MSRTTSPAPSVTPSTISRSSTRSMNASVPAQLVARLRPRVGPETERDTRYGFSVEGNGEDTVLISKKAGTMAGGKDVVKYYDGFNKVYGEEVSPTEVYQDALQDTLMSCLDNGKSLVIPICGESGSGKSFTLSSSHGLLSFISREVYAEDRPPTRVQVSAIEIRYDDAGTRLKERMFDLSGDKGLGGGGWTGVGGGGWVKGSDLLNARVGEFPVLVDCKDEVNLLLTSHTMLARRHTEQGPLNATSSRGHVVYNIMVTRGEMISTICLVDFAGYESNSGPESIWINKSHACTLAVLGSNVIGDKKQSIPRSRESNLSWMLSKNRIRGDQVIGILCLSPLTSATGRQQSIVSTFTSLQGGVRKVKMPISRSVTPTTSYYPSPSSSPTPSFGLQSRSASQLSGHSRAVTPNVESSAVSTGGNRYSQAHTDNTAYQRLKVENDKLAVELKASQKNNAQLQGLLDALLNGGEEGKEERMGLMRLWKRGFETDN